VLAARNQAQAERAWLNNYVEQIAAKGEGERCLELVVNELRRCFRAVRSVDGGG